MCSLLRIYVQPFTYICAAFYVYTRSPLRIYVPYPISVRQVAS